MMVSAMQENSTYEIIVNEENQGMRIDAYLALFLSEVSRSFLQKIILGSNVIVNGTIQTSKKYRVESSDKIIVTMPEPELLNVEPEDIAIDIVYEDDELLVVNKAKGMVVHPAVGNYSGTLVNAIMFHCKGRLSSINGVIRPGIVHRIDKDTSGLLVVAKNDKSHEFLAKQLAEHTMTRKYIAIARDNIKKEEGIIDIPIGRDPKNRLRQSVNGINPKKAVTHFRVLKRFGKKTLIEVTLETGRTHQIRVHMAYIKHPLLGDTVYGPAKQIPKVEGQMLHAKTLGFIHPTTHKYIEFNSEVPDDFSKVIEKVAH